MTTHPARSFSGLLVGVCLFLSAPRAPAETVVPDSNAISAAAENFHKALAAGRADEVMALLQPDALIVEGGTVQTRDEYQTAHLGEDIAYARAVPSRPLKVVVREEGDVGWVTSIFSAQGTFKDKTVSNLAAETMVLSKTSKGWRIRTIHWSSHHEH